METKCKKYEFRSFAVETESCGVGGVDVGRRRHYTCGLAPVFYDD